MGIFDVDSIKLYSVIILILATFIQAFDIDN